MERKSIGMLIGLGCGFAGLLTAMICNFAVMRALPGLAVGLLLCLAGAALQGAFAAAALRADAEEEYDAGALREYRVRVIASVKRIGMALLAMIALILPLAACLPGISAGYVDVWVQPEEWLRGAALCGALLGTAACLGLYLLNRRLAAEGLYPVARRHAHAWVAGILTAAMCLTLLIDAVTVNSSWMDNPDAWANFTDFAAFQQWCEEQAANGKNEQSDENAGAQIAAYYYDENGNEVPIQDVFRATVYDPKSDYKRAGRNQYRGTVRMDGIFCGGHRYFPRQHGGAAGAHQGGLSDQIADHPPAFVPRAVAGAGSLDPDRGKLSFSCSQWQKIIQNRACRIRAFSL